MRHNKEWDSINRSDLKHQTPFIADGRYYVSQTKIPTPIPLWAIILFISAFVFFPLAIFWLNGDEIQFDTSLIIWFGFVGIFFILLMQGYLQGRRHKKRFKRFQPHQLYMPSASFQRGQALQCQYRLLLKEGQKLGESVRVSARLLCQEGVEVTRGTDTVDETQQHWSAVLPEQPISAHDKAIIYTIKQPLPAELPASIDDPKHWIHWYVQVRLKFAKNSPFFVAFRVEVV